MDRRRVERVRGMLYGESIWSENVGRALWVNPSVVLITKKCTNILCTVFLLYFTVMSRFVSPVFTSKEKAELCRVVFFYVVVLAEQ